MLTNSDQSPLTDIAPSENGGISNSHLWERYPKSYRARDMRILANWLAEGASGTVVGLPGSGRATLLGFLCNRPDALPAYVGSLARSIALIPVDLNILPDNSLATFYRVILRSFFHSRQQFTPALQRTIVELYRKNEAVCDPFPPQSALLELLALLQAEGIRVALILNRFDEFCQSATPQLTQTLRSLRDNFKNTLSYVIGMLQEVAYLPDPAAVGPLYELLDTNVHWVGPLEETDARYRIAWRLQAASPPPNEEDIAHLWRLTGGFPALIMVACHWWRAAARRPSPPEWPDALLAEPTMQYRLEDIWRSLTQEEQFVLAELQRVEMLHAAAADSSEAEQRKRRQELQSIERQYHDVLARLQAKGVCRPAEEGWRVFSQLFVRYVSMVKGRGRGKIWLDGQRGEFYQGQTPLTTLAPTEQAILKFLVESPRARRTHTDIIEAAWPDEILKEGVSTETLYQHIRRLRKKIEPDSGHPVYIVNWRGQPEGGYQFFPEGRPG